MRDVAFEDAAIRGRFASALVVANRRSAHALFTFFVDKTRPDQVHSELHFKGGASCRYSTLIR